MNISISHNFPSGISTGTNKQFTRTTREKSDCCEFSSKQKTPSFKKSFFASFFAPKNEIPKYIDNNAKPPSDFAVEISKNIEKAVEKKIPAENFASIMTPEEFRGILPSLKEENFISNRKNRDSGIYCADLDYQSNFSNGTQNIFDLLDDVAAYADEYYKKTGKKFIFALADRDLLEGLQHAVRIIGSDPEKFKNVKFLPAFKMSFAHKAPTSGLGYENSEMIIYGVNPFSENLINFVENTIQKRKKMTVEFIKKVNHLYPEFAYSIIEFAQQNQLKYKRSFAVSNLYWRAREYAETKGDTAIRGKKFIPEDVIVEAENILNELDDIYLGSENSGFSPLGTTIIKDSEVNKNIKEVFEEYSTHFDESQGRVISAAENLYDDMIDCLSKEPQKPVLALSAPFYFSHYFEESGSKTFEKVVKFIKELQENSNGMLLAFESVVPKYDLDSNLTPDIIKNFNNYMRNNTDLYEVGGSFAKRMF